MINIVRALYISLCITYELRVTQLYTGKEDRRGILHYPLPVMSQDLMEGVLRFIDGWNNASCVEQVTQQGEAFFRNPDALLCLPHIYQQSPNAYHRRSVLIWYSHIMNTEILETFSAEHVTFIQDSLVQLLAFEAEDEMLTIITDLVVGLLKKTNVFWPSLNMYIQSPRTAQFGPNFRILTELFASRIVPLPESFEPFLGMVCAALQGTCNDRMSAICYMFSFAGFVDDVSHIMPFIGAIQAILKEFVDTGDEQQIHTFLTILEFAIKEIDNEFDVTGAICRTSDMCALALCREWSYTTRILIREYLNVRFRNQLLASEELETVFKAMIELSNWFYSQEIDESTSKINDFRDILKMTGISVFVEAAQALLGTGTAFAVCTALDLMRAMIAMHGQIPGMMDLIVKCLEFQGDQRIKILASSLLMDFEETLSSEIDVYFDNIIAAVGASLGAMIQIPVEERDQCTTALLHLLNQIINPQRDIASCFGNLYTMCLSFFEHGTIREQGATLVLFGMLIYAGPHAMTAGCTNSPEIVFRFLQCPDSFARSVAYSIIPVLTLKYKEQVESNFGAIMTLISAESDMDVVREIVTTFGKLMNVTSALTMCIDPVIEFIHRALVAARSDDSDDWVLVRNCVSSLVQIAVEHECKQEQLWPIIYETTLELIDSEDVSGISSVFDIFESSEQLWTTECIAQLATKIYALIISPDTNDDVVAPLSKLMGTLLYDKLELSPEQIEVLLNAVITKLVGAFTSDFLYEESNRNLTSALLLFLQYFILSIDELNEHTARIIMQLFQVACTAAGSESAIVRKSGYALFGYIAGGVNPLDHAAWRSVTENGLSRLGDANDAKYVAALIGAVAKNKREALADVTPAICQQLVARLVASSEEAASQECLCMRDTIISALCALNSGCAVIGFDQFIDLLGRFLPAKNDWKEFEEIYTFICDNCGSAEAPETRNNVFRILMEFAVYSMTIMPHIRGSYLNDDMIGKIYMVINAYLSATENPQLCISTALNGDANDIENFREFMTLAASILG